MSKTNELLIFDPSSKWKFAQKWEHERSFSDVGELCRLNFQPSQLQMARGKHGTISNKTRKIWSWIELTDFSESLGGQRYRGAYRKGYGELEPGRVCIHSAEGFPERIEPWKIQQVLICIQNWDWVHSLNSKKWGDDDDVQKTWVFVKIFLFHSIFPRLAGPSFIFIQLCFCSSKLLIC